MSTSEDLKIFNFLELLRRIKAEVIYSWAEIVPFETSKGTRKNFNLRSTEEYSLYHNIIVIDLVHTKILNCNPSYKKLEFGIAGATIKTSGKPNITLLGNSFTVLPGPFDFKILEIQPNKLTIMDDAPKFIGINNNDREYKLVWKNDTTNTKEELPF